ncbi:prepilin peptidase [Blastococcus saxobsidens]|uniref:Prepilin signal peptidase n=1 Tax=Blastococcus saxobsidens (strain DD2) TaxID=1146883 RepID=H6RRS5_BLASD|nr:A24 family peptidase [Blastococcus saxobsidens]CCG02919.1 Prepilin signal peptidase [Blastococcus saxobsidens DD2]
MSAVAVALMAAVAGIPVGHLVNRAAGRFPWPAQIRLGQLVGPGPVAVRPPVLELVSAVLFGLVGLRFGASAELPAFLFLGGAGLLLAVVDLRHRLLPNRVIIPSVVVGLALLAVPVAVDGNWPALLRAGLGSVVLFLAFLVLALIAPSGLGMGDVKLAALLGLYLGWLGWTAVVLGGASGFVLQAVVVLPLLALRRIGLRSELPFGPAMLAGAALVVLSSTVAA